MKLINAKHIIIAREIAGIRYPEEFLQHKMDELAADFGREILRGGAAVTTRMESANEITLGMTAIVMTQKEYKWLTDELNRLSIERIPDEVKTS